MLIQWALETIIPWLLVIGALTELVVPLLRGTQLFPTFRRRKVHHQVQEAAEELEQLEEVQRAVALHQEAEQLKDKIRQTR